MASKKLATLMTSKSKISPLVSPNLDLQARLSPGSVSVSEFILTSSPTRRLSDYSPRKSPSSFGGDIFFGSSFNSVLEFEQDKRETSAQQQCKVAAGKDQLYPAQLHGSRSSPNAGDEASESTRPLPLTNSSKGRGVSQHGKQQPTIILAGSNEGTFGNKSQSNSPEISCAIPSNLPEDKKNLFKVASAVNRSQKQESTSPKHFPGNKSMINRDGVFSVSQKMLPSLRSSAQMVGEEGCTLKNASSFENEDWKEEASTTAVSSTEQVIKKRFTTHDRKTSHKPIKPFVNEYKGDSMPFLFPLGQKSPEKPRQLFRHTLGTSKQNKDNYESSTLGCNSKTVVRELELEDIESKEEKMPQTKCAFVEQQWRTQRQQQQEHHHQQQQQQQQHQQRRPKNLLQKQPQVKICKSLGQMELNDSQLTVEVSCPRESDLEGNILLEVPAGYPPHNSTARLGDILTPIELEAQSRHIRRQQQKEQSRKIREENNIFE